MRRAIKITEQQLKGLLGDLLSMATGKDKTDNSSKDSNDTTTSDTSTVKTSGPISSSKIVGSGWESCKAWKSKGGVSGWSNNIKIEKGSSQFKVSYKGPSSGLSIAHADKGKDTIHQIYNVLICELNPFLVEKKLKPNLESIKTEGSKNGKDSIISITVPLVSSNETYQIDRRGGWGHDPGAFKMKHKCDEINEKGGKCFGPVRNVLQAPFGNIKEYFITHTI